MAEYTGWFDKGWVLLQKDMAAAAGIELESFKKVYSIISEYGLTDYDIEKEVVYNWLEDEEDE